MANLNKVFLMGNLTRDPELRYTPSGTAICEFGLAINRQWTTPDGEKRDETCFVDCNMWGRRGEVIAEYLRKGQAIFIEGRLQLDQWEGQDGQKRSKLRVVADNFEFIGGRGGGSGAEGSSDRGEGRPSARPARPAGPRPAPRPAPAPPRSQEPPAQEAQQPPKADEEGFNVKDDDIPF